MSFDLKLNYDLGAFIKKLNKIKIKKTNIIK